MPIHVTPSGFFLNDLVEIFPKNMEELASIISAYFHDPKFWVWFWFIIGFVAALWNGFYFFRKQSFTEKELEEISPKYLAISAKYQLFMMGWFFLVMLLIVLSTDDFLIVPVVSPRYIFGAFIPSYGISQGVFALLYGVYPQGKSLLFIYTDESIIRRVAIFQILTSIIAAIMTFVFMQNI